MVILDANDAVIETRNYMVACEMRGCRPETAPVAATATGDGLKSIGIEGCRFTIALEPEQAAKGHRLERWLASGLPPTG